MILLLSPFFVMGTGYPTLPVREAFGALQPGEKVSEARFDFSVDELSDPLMLHFTPGNILSSEELRIELNGILIGRAFQCEGSWGAEQRIWIDADRLRPNRNELRFLIQRAEAKEKRWGIRNIYVVRAPVTKQQNENPEEMLKEAELLFARSQNQPELYRKIENQLRMATQRWATLGREIPKELRELESKMEVRKDLYINKLLLEANVAKREGEFARAHSIYDRLLSEVLSSSDVRRKRIENLLKETNL